MVVSSPHWLCCIPSPVCAASRSSSSYTRPFTLHGNSSLKSLGLLTRITHNSLPGCDQAPSQGDRIWDNPHSSCRLRACLSQSFQISAIAPWVKLSLCRRRAFPSVSCLHHWRKLSPQGSGTILKDLGRIAEASKTIRFVTRLRHLRHNACSTKSA